MPDLSWFGDHGFYPVDSTGVYDQAYFDKYAKMAATPMGREILNARMRLVDTFIDPRRSLVDVGIGCGDFVRARRCMVRLSMGEKINALGYDVNPAGVSWLVERNMFWDLSGEPVHAMTFWDSLEHIEAPDLFLAKAKAFVFVSIPIFEDEAHVRRSRHFRPTEHYHYFTRLGLVRYMEELGFRMVLNDKRETELGREDIESFVFQRVGSLRA